MTNFETLNKAALREACKVRGISGYGKLDNDGMRTALTKHEAKNAPKEPVVKPEDMPVQSAPVVTTPVAAEAPAAAPAPDPMSEPSRVAAKQDKPAPAPKVAAEQRNGIAKPGRGLTLEVWQAAAALKAEGKDVTFAALKEKLPNHNVSTIRTQMGRFNSFHKEPAK